MNFKELISQIIQTHTSLQQNAAKSVNFHITLRNWLIGFYIVEFEQIGEDRAAYGTKVLENIAESISLKGLTAPELSRCRQFYQTYPEFQSTIFKNFKKYLTDSSSDTSNLYQILNPNLPILGTVSQELENNTAASILGTVSQELETSKNEDLDQYLVKIFTKISYSHFVELIKIKDTTKRKFYELLIIRNTLSVRELCRQISTLTYERIGISQDPVAAIDEMENKIDPKIPNDAIKSLYFFDFFELQTKNLINESQLEQALINHLEQFILELGNGFCFEARQKRILIDDQYYFIDLVFYHRILKCHILIELKIDQFKHEHLSQLNCYVSAFRDQVMQKGDNPPIGILLCTEKGPKMVEYALAGLEEKLFVSKYLLKLPTSELLENFIESELKNI